MLNGNLSKTFAKGPSFLCTAGTGKTSPIVLSAFKCAARGEADSGGSSSHRWHFPTSAPRRPRSLCRVPSHLIPHKRHAAARSACLCNQMADKCGDGPGDASTAVPVRLSASSRGHLEAAGGPAWTHGNLTVLPPLTCPVEQITAGPPGSPRTAAGGAHRGHGVDRPLAA